MKIFGWIRLIWESLVYARWQAMHPGTRLPEWERDLRRMREALR